MVKYLRNPNYTKEPYMKTFTRLLSLITILTLFTTTLIFAEDEPSIHSEAGIVIDGETGQVLYQKNPHKQLNPASITKLLTALVALESLNPQDTMTFTKEAIDTLDYGSSRIGIQEGETITVNDAFHGLLLMSANEVANAIAEETSGSISEFVIDMNRKAAELGALNSNFENPHGLNQANHLTTVYDMALITKEIIKNDYFLEIMQHTMYQIPETNKQDEIRYLSQQHKMLNNKNDMRIYREDVIAGKIGYTKESGHTLVTAAKQNDRTLIVVIMNTDSHNLYTDTEKLLDYGYNNFEANELNASLMTKTIVVQDNDVIQGKLVLEAVDNVSLLLPIDYKQDLLKYSIVEDESTNLNSTIGSVGGQCHIIMNDEVTMKVPLVITNIDIVEQEEADEQISEVVSIEEDTQTEAIDKKSMLPLFLILLTFGGLTFICLPKKRIRR